MQIEIQLTFALFVTKSVAYNLMNLTKLGTLYPFFIFCIQNDEILELRPVAGNMQKYVIPSICDKHKKPRVRGAFYLVLNAVRRPEHCRTEIYVNSKREVQSLVREETPVPQARNVKARHGNAGKGNRNNASPAGTAPIQNPPSHQTHPRIFATWFQIHFGMHCWR